RLLVSNAFSFAPMLVGPFPVLCLIVRVYSSIPLFSSSIHLDLEFLLVPFPVVFHKWCEFYYIVLVFDRIPFSLHPVFQSKNVPFVSTALALSSFDPTVLSFC